MNTRSPTPAAGASRRGEPRTPPKQSYVEKDSDQSDEVASTDSLDSTAGDAMIGRKIVKSVGETVCSGVVRDFFPATGNQEESKWKVEWDDGDDVMAVVNRAELDKYLRMQMTKEAVFGPAATATATASKRGRGQSRATASPKTPSRSTPTSTRKMTTRNSPTSTESWASTSKSPPPSARKSTPGKKRSAVSSKADSATKKGKTAKVSRDGPKKRERVVLFGNRSDMGNLVAKEFEDGIYTGEVVKIKMGHKTLWNVRYEDGDGEDLNMEEVLTCMRLYQLLLSKYSSAKGSTVLCASKGSEQEDDDATFSPTAGVGKSPGKRGKGKGKKRTSAASAREAAGLGMVGSRVRKLFEMKAGKTEYNGTVFKFFPEEVDDDHGDMWLINYDDGDSEHFDADEVAASKDLYDKHFALQKKEVEFPINASVTGEGATNVSKARRKMTLFAEKPESSRIFSTLDGYREYKKTNA